MKMKEFALSMLNSKQGMITTSKYVSVNNDKSTDIYHPLPPICVNPASHSAAVEIIRQYCEMANVIKVSSDKLFEAVTCQQEKNNVTGTKQRYFIDFICDAGVSTGTTAHYTCDRDVVGFDDDDGCFSDQQEYPRVVFRLEHFHIYKNFLETVLNVVKLMCPAKLLHICGYETVYSQEFLLCGSNIRRSYDWIHDCLLLALIGAMITSYAQYFIDGANQQNRFPFVKDGSINFETFAEYTSWACGVDYTFQCYYSLIMDVLLPLTLLKTAMRTSNFQEIDCARIKLLPLCFAFYNTNYDPRYVKEIILLFHRIQSYVLKHCANHFSFDCKGVDERMEVHNKDVISMMSKTHPSESKIRMATLLQQMSCNLSTVIESCLVHKSSVTMKREEHGREQIHIDQLVL